MPESPEREFAAAVDEAVGRVARTSADIWADLRKRAADLHPEFARVVDAAADLEGGKYVRARLAAVSYLGLGGDDPDLLDSIGSAVQCLHLGLCIHDDVIDADDTRHGRFNTYGTIRNRERDLGHPPDVADRQALAAALLAGDLAVNTATRALAIAPAPGEVRTALLDVMTAALERTIAGEILDIRDELSPIADSSPLVVADLKTAEYSVTLPLRLGAVAAECRDEAVLAALGRIGVALGTGYQLVDDDLGVFGDPETTGKPAGSDLRSGKRTRIVQLAYQAATDEQRARMSTLMAATTRDDEACAELLAIIESTGARERLHAEIAAQTEQAIAAAADLPAAMAGYLTALARSFVARAA